MTAPGLSHLAPFAVANLETRGRVHPRSDPDDECPFELDRHRILSCTAFRRLMYKTQVFVTGEGDHFRTRLTHTLEVAAQAERLARLLQLNDRLAGAIAMAHDLGHPPFGHAGEAELDKLMKDHGGFEHNVQSLRVVDQLEHPYPAFRGLNLSFEVREALIKHHTRYDRPADAADSGLNVRDLFEDGPRCTLEGQVANLADAVAYTLHDIEDGLGQGVLTEEALNQSRIWREVAEPITKAFPVTPIAARRRPILDNIAAQLARDAHRASAALIAKEKIDSVDQVRHHTSDLIAFSPEIREGSEALQAILLKSVYRNHRVVRMDAKAGRIIHELFEAYLSDPRLMPERFSSRIEKQDPHRVICDFIAGMTDRFCQREHERLFGPFDRDR